MNGWMMTELETEAGLGGGRFLFRMMVYFVWFIIQQNNNAECKMQNAECRESKVEKALPGKRP
jgi:hypothetical protein